ncbi:hypothetical protein T492DRAFT_1028764 [Pavlovales sp. CCMP2436]|nr:hypothetical protein T492DRAFT_1028764 [Pavlovales sp. CCMP2436]
MAETQLSTYVEQLSAVEDALSLAPDDEELLKLRDDLKELVSTLSDLAKIEQAGKAADFRVGDKVLALSGEGWHPARVDRVTDKGYDVVFMGTLRGTLELVAKAAIKQYAMPDVSAFAAGQSVSAWYAGDRSFYKAVVQQINADGSIAIIYAGFEGVENLEPECVILEGDVPAETRAAGGAGPSRTQPLEPSAADAGASKKRPLTIPASLEIKPDDTPEVIKRKEKKIKAITRQQQLADKEDAVNEQRSNWQTFVTKKKGYTKLTRSNHDPTYDPERDHQEMARARDNHPSAREGGW